MAGDLATDANVVSDSRKKLLILMGFMMAAVLLPIVVFVVMQ